MHKNVLVGQAEKKTQHSGGVGIGGGMIYKLDFRREIV